MAAVMPMPSLGAAAELDLEAVRGGGLRGGDDLLDGRDGDVGGVGGELDLGEGDVPLVRLGDLVRTGGRERAGHALDVGQRLQAGDDLADCRLIRRARDGRCRMEDDVGGVPRLRRKPLLQNVRRLLRRGVPRRELVLEMGAHHLSDDRDADDGQDPQGQNRPAAVVTGTGQASQDGFGLFRRLILPIPASHRRCTTKIHH